MIRHAIVAVVGCGLFACAKGTETSSKQQPASATKAESAPAAASGAGRLSDTTVVAKWNGGQLTYGELVEAHRTDFRKLLNKQKSEQYSFERQRIEASVVQTLVQAAAEKKGQTEQAFLDAEVGKPTVSDEEVKKLFDSDPRLKAQPFEQFAPRIRSYLEQQKKQQALIAVFERLKKEAGMQVSLPRIPLEKITFELAGRPSKGKDTAKVTVVEFSDFECPFCSRAVSGVEELVKAYPDDVRVVFMHFPLNSHPNAVPAAVASQCANQQGKFWPFHDAIFANQGELTKEKFEAHAKTTGLDMTKYNACVSDPKTAAFVDEDMKQGNDAGVEGTPTFFINGEPHSGGVPTVDDLKVYLEG